MAVDVGNKRRSPDRVSTDPTGLKLAEKMIEELCTSSLIHPAMIEGMSALRPGLITTPEASKFMERHAEEIFSKDAHPTRSRVKAVRHEAQSVINLLRHLNDTAIALERKLVLMASAAEAGEYEDDSE